MDEIAQAVKGARSQSSPSPVDGIPYTVFKKCPALLVALHNIFNLCWTIAVVPAGWKQADVKLIGKTSARSDPSSPANFRPIALTSCVGKAFLHQHQELVAQVHAWQPVSWQVNPESVHASNTRLLWPPPETVHYSQRCKEEIPLTGCLLDRSGQRLWECALLPHPLRSSTLPHTLQTDQSCWGLLHWFGCQS